MIPLFSIIYYCKVSSHVPLLHSHTHTHTSVWLSRCLIMALAVTEISVFCQLTLDPWPQHSVVFVMCVWVRAYVCVCACTDSRQEFYHISLPALYHPATFQSPDLILRHALLYPYCPSSMFSRSLTLLRLCVSSTLKRLSTLVSPERFHFNRLFSSL